MWCVPARVYRWFILNKPLSQKQRWLVRYVSSSRAWKVTFRLLLSRRVGGLRTPARRAPAEAEGLTLLESDNKAGYYGVYHHPGQPKPFLARVTRGGNLVNLGCFATAEEAALHVARSPEGRAAARKAAAAPPLTSEEARQQARAEGLTLLEADNKAGYFGVCINNPGSPKPFLARVRRGGKLVYLGCFATAEKAALCIAQSPEGRAAAERAAAAPLLTSEEAEVVEVLEAEEVDEEAENVQMVEVVVAMEPEVVVDEAEERVKFS